MVKARRRWLQIVRRFAGIVGILRRCALSWHCLGLRRQRANQAEKSDSEQGRGPYAVEECHGAGNYRRFLKSQARREINLEPIARELNCRRGLIIGSVVSDSQTISAYSQAKQPQRPSRLDIPDIARHAAFRLVEQALKCEASPFSQLERCRVLRKDSEDNLASFRSRSQILSHEVYGP